MDNKTNNYSNIDPSVLIAKADLYPKIWNPKTNSLNDQISIKLKHIARDFIASFDYPIKIRDIILTGSIANYNWNQFSDIDLHIVIDFDDVPEQYATAFKDYFDAKKNLWNKNHIINIVGHEVEIYIQDINELHHSTGVFSVLNNKWLVEPSHKDADIDFELIISKTQDLIDRINSISKLLQDKDYDRAISAVEALQNKIKKNRKAGLEKGGEYSTENLVFKMLRNGNHLEVLSNFKRQAYDNKMSIEEEIFQYQKIIEEGKKDACYYKAKAKYKVWPCVPENSSKALTRKGWKNVEQLSVGEEIMTYSIEKDILEFKPIKNIHRYKNAPTKVVRSGNTGFMFESTDEHKWVIRMPKTKSDNRKKYATNHGVCLLETAKLMENKYNKLLIVSSVFDEKNNGTRKEKFYKYGDNWLEYIINCSFEQRQAWLFSAIVYDGNQNKVERLTENKNNINDLEWKYDNEQGRQAFGFKQKDIIHRDAFLLSAFLNGGMVSWKRAKNQDIYNCHYISNKREKNTSNFKIVNEDIKDVWCPETENETWVMQQEVGNNGIITITGNSAYASGYLVKCRKKKGKIKEEEIQEEIELDEETLEELSQLDEKDTFSKEKESGLHGWFARQGGKGKSKGWVDCNTCRTNKETGRKSCKSCGRQGGEKRSKYPACRPTPSQCTKTGMKNKKSSKQVSWKSKKDK